MRYRHLFFCSVISLSFTAPALAAEPGTYRPGTPYYSTQAGSANICEQQCSGDAQCKGWNFVSVNPNAPNGVCEFNSLNASPVPSEISVSGSNGAPSYSRRVSAGGTSTVRVGAPEPAPRSVRSNVIAARTAPVRRFNQQAYTSSSSELSSVRPGARAIRPEQAGPSRRVVRQPIAQRRQPSQSSYRAPSRAAAPLMRAQAPQQPRFQHNLDQGVPQKYIPQRAQQTLRPQLSAPQSARRPATNSRPNLPASGFQGGDPRLQNMVRQRAASPATSTRAAPQPQVQAQPRAQSVSRPPQTPLPLRRPQSLAEVEQSLFGSLNDDVKAPKPMTQAEQNNPDAPIATVSSVPVKRVTTESLLGLAGAPNP